MNTTEAYDLNSRLYVELIPDPSSQQYLTQLTQELSKVVTGRFIQPHKWHVTVIHFGKVQDVYNDLLTLQPSLEKTQFISALNRYAQASATVLKDSISLATEQYDLFGEHDNVLVLRFKSSDQIITAHAQALSYLQTFFNECGIADSAKFMHGNHNFKHALDIKPHITLVRQINYADVSVLASPKTTLRFLPVDIAGL